MRKRVRHKTEASLVPLADMLANTVGILLFILAFTVLASGGAMIMKRLPREHSESKLTSLMFLIRSDGIYPVDDDQVDAAAKQSGGNLPGSSGGTKPPQVQTAFFTYEASMELINTSGGQIMIGTEINVTPKPGKGMSVERAIAEDKGAVAKTLATHKPDSHFIYCLVEPEAIGNFQAFREHVTERWHYSVGWSPHRTGKPIIISGSGTAPIPQ